MRRGSGMGPAPLGSSWSRGEVPASRETSSPMGKSVGIEGKYLRLSEESETAGPWSTGQSENYTDGPCSGPREPDWDMCPLVHTGPRAGMWELESIARGKTTVRCEETAWGDRREEINKWECLWRKPRLPWKQGTTVEWCTEGGATTAASLSPCTSPCPLGTRKSPCQGWPLQGQALEKATTRAGSLTPMAIGFTPHLSPPGLKQPRQPCHLRALSSMGQTWVLHRSLGSRHLWVAHT